MDSFSRQAHFELVLIVPAVHSVLLAILSTSGKQHILICTAASRINYIDESYHRY